MWADTLKRTLFEQESNRKARSLWKVDNFFQSKLSLPLERLRGQEERPSCQSQISSEEESCVILYRVGLLIV